MAKNDHGKCARCNSDFNGGSIWEHFYNEFQTKGYWKNSEGKHLPKKIILSPEDAAIAADEVAANYGATRISGQWGREIGITINDRVAKWKCPDCGYIWDRI